MVLYQDPSRRMFKRQSLLGCVTPLEDELHYAKHSGAGLP